MASHSECLYEEISAIADNSDTLRELVEQLKSPVGVIPFVGAGISTPFGFPAWTDFLLRQAESAGMEHSVKALLSSSQYEEAAESLLAARGYRAFHDALNRAYGRHKLVGKKISGAAAVMPRLASGPVITTNFDHVLEKTFEQSGLPFEQIVTGARATLATRALFQQRRFLLKIHGDAEDELDRIITRSDYQTYYGHGAEDGNSIDLSLPLPKLLQHLLMSRPLLFMGCSLHADRTVRVLEHIAREFRAITAYAVVERPNNADDIYSRARFLSNLNIRPIWYPQGRHEYIEPLLLELARQRPQQWNNVDDIVHFIDSMASKMVLILGSFTPERKRVLDAIRDELGQRGYLPVLFDFEKPASRDITETISILARLSRFIVADLTEPRSIARDLEVIVPHTPVPVQPLLLEGETIFTMSTYLLMYSWMLPVYRYRDLDTLIAELTDHVIAPAEAQADELQRRRTLPIDDLS